MIIHKHSPKEEGSGNQNKKETYAQSLTPFYTSFYLLQLPSLLLASYYMLLYLLLLILSRVQAPSPRLLLPACLLAIPDLELEARHPTRIGDLSGHRNLYIVSYKIN